MFFGTHELAVPALDALRSELDCNIVLTVSRPFAGLEDAEGVGSDIPELRTWSKAHDVPWMGSDDGAGQKLIDRLTELSPDLLVVVDYGRPLSAEVLATAARGGLEIQASALPKLRGEHALRAALSTGLKKTGVTAYRLDESPWAGPILLQEELEIGPHDTIDDLLPAAEELTRQMVVEAVQKLDRNKREPKTRAQNERSKSEVPYITQRHRRAPWSLEAPEVYNRFRSHALLETSLSYRSVLILGGRPLTWEDGPYGVTGTFLGMRQGRLAVLCAGGTVFGIERLERPGEEPQTASDFIRAEQLSIGDMFV